MSFKKIIGQPLAVQLLQRWLAQETTQPLLFYGPAGAGKRTVALETAKALNCNSIPHPNPLPSRERAEGEGWSCGNCPSCKKIAELHHPDVCVLDMSYQAAVRGEPVEKQQALRIETVLSERKRLYQTAVEGPWKISILDEAHRLTPDAANVLLKVLEEPPPRTAIFLLTPFRDRLFATIVSRCQPVRFRALSSAEKPKTLTLDEIQAIRETDALWNALPQMTPGKVLAQEPRARSGGPARNDIDEKIQRLLAPALRDLQAGDPVAVDALRLIQQAHQQLRQNVPPSLVYDHLLLKLSQRSKR